MKCIYLITERSTLAAKCVHYETLVAMLGGAERCVVTVGEFNSDKLYLFDLICGTERERGEGGRER